MWYNWFKEETIEHENIEAVKKVILENRRITIKVIADDVGISFDLCQAIFTDVLGMKLALAKIVPKLLNFEHNQRSMDFAQEILTTFKNDSYLLKQIITGDELWMYDIHTHTKLAITTLQSGLRPSFSYR